MPGLEKYIDRMKSHMKADELIRGVGFDDGKGCAVGCTLDSYDHKRFPEELNIPIWAARLLDRLYENMSLEKSKTYPLLFLEAANTLSDEERMDKFNDILKPLLISALEPLLIINCNTDEVNKVLKLLKDKSTTDEEFESSATAASYAAAGAYAATDAAAYAAADAAAYAAAAAATAYAAADAAAYAAAAAATAYAAATAGAYKYRLKREEYIEKIADKFIQLIKGVIKCQA